VDPKVLGLIVLIDHSQPGGSWMTRRSPPITWWSQRGGDDTSWLATIENDLSLHNVSVEDVTKLALDRPLRNLLTKVELQAKQ